MERHPKVEITRLHSIIKDIHLTRRMVTERRQIRTRLHLTNTHTALDLQVHLQVGRRRPVDFHLDHHLDMVHQHHLIVTVIHLEATLHLRKLQATRQDQEGLHQILWHRHLEITLILEVNMDHLLRPQLLDLRLQMQLHHLHHRLRPQLHRLRQLLHRRQLHLRQQLKLNKGHPVVRHQVQHLLLHPHLPLPIDLPMLLRPNTLREPIAPTDPRLVGHQMHLHLIPEFQLNLLPVHLGTTHPHPMVVPIHITTKVQVLTHPLINLIPIQATTSILQAILDRLDLQILKAHHLLKDIHKVVIIRIIHQVVTTLRLMALLPRSIIKDIRHMDSMVLHHLKWASLVIYSHFISTNIFLMQNVFSRLWTIQTAASGRSTSGRPTSGSATATSIPWLRSNARSVPASTWSRWPSTSCRCTSSIFCSSSWSISPAARIYSLEFGIKVCTVATSSHFMNRISPYFITVSLLLLFSKNVIIIKDYSVCLF